MIIVQFVKVVKNSHKFITVLSRFRYKVLDGFNDYPFHSPRIYQALLGDTIPSFVIQITM